MKLSGRGSSQAGARETSSQALSKPTSHSKSAARERNGPRNTIGADGAGHQHGMRCTRQRRARNVGSGWEPDAVRCRYYSRELAKRLLRHQDALFQFVRHAHVPADNNLAERALHPLVMQRKISGGSRSRQGSATRMQLASLFGTWQALGSVQRVVTHFRQHGLRIPVRCWGKLQGDDLV